MKNLTPPPTDIRNSLAYDAETGVFTWLQKPSARVMAGSIAGTICAHGYRHIIFLRRSYMAGRLAWWFAHGVWANKDVDHRNGSRDDNRICNLRLATRTENCQNKTRVGVSGLKGVRQKPNSRRWEARICVNSRPLYLGGFDSPQSAARAYDAAAREHFGPFAKTNFAEAA